MQWKIAIIYKMNWNTFHRAIVIVWSIPIWFWPRHRCNRGGSDFGVSTTKFRPRTSFEFQAFQKGQTRWWITNQVWNSNRWSRFWFSREFLFPKFTFSRFFHQFSQHNQNFNFFRCLFVLFVRFFFIKKYHQTVDKAQYLTLLANLRVITSNQAFLIQGNQQEMLASDNLDLRSFLEMFLFEMPDRKNNSEKVDQAIDEMFLQKKIVSRKLRAIRDIQKEYNAEADERRQKVEAEMDKHLLEIVYHKRHTEHLGQKIGAGDQVETPNVTKNELIERLQNWVKKFILIMTCAVIWFLVFVSHRMRKWWTTAFWAASLPKSAEASLLSLR